MRGRSPRIGKGLPDTRGRSPRIWKGLPDTKDPGHEGAVAAYREGPPGHARGRSRA